MECPSCHVNVEVSEQLYGALYTCNECKAVYFINFDGQPEFGEVSEEVLEDIVSEPNPPESFSTEPIAAPSLDFGHMDNSNLPQPDTQEENAPGGFESSLEPLIDSVDVVDFDTKLDQQFGGASEESPSSEIQNADISNNEFQNTEMQSFENASLSNPLENPVNPSTDYSSMDYANNNYSSFESPMPVPEPMTSSLDQSPEQPQSSSSSVNPFGDVAKEISDFANTDVQLASLNYDLKISGLDTHELRRLFQEAIEDSRLGWEANEIMKNIKNGQIEFLQLNPVKAYILAKRLQFLDIEKNWKQNAIA